MRHGEPLCQVYKSRICQEHLHRGDLKKLISREESLNLVIDVPEIIKLAQKIIDLLGIHVIAINETDAITCALKNVDDHGRVQVATLKRGEPPNGLPVIKI